MKLTLREQAEKLGFPKATIGQTFEQDYEDLGKKYKHVSNQQLIEWAVYRSRSVKRKPSIMEQMTMF